MERKGGRRERKESYPLSSKRREKERERENFFTTLDELLLSYCKSSEPTCASLHGVKERLGTRDKAVKF